MISVESINREDQVERLTWYDHLLANLEERNASAMGQVFTFHLDERDTREPDFSDKVGSAIDRSLGEQFGDKGISEKAWSVSPDKGDWQVQVFVTGDKATPDKLAEVSRSYSKELGHGEERGFSPTRDFERDTPERGFSKGFRPQSHQEKDPFARLPDPYAKFDSGRVLMQQEYPHPSEREMKDLLTKLGVKPEQEKLSGMDRQGSLGQMRTSLDIANAVDKHLAARGAMSEAALIKSVMRDVPEAKEHTVRSHLEGRVSGSFQDIGRDKDSGQYFNKGQGARDAMLGQDIREANRGMEKGREQFQTGRREDIEKKGDELTRTGHRKLVEIKDDRDVKDLIRQGDRAERAVDKAQSSAINNPLLYKDTRTQEDKAAMAAMSGKEKFELMRDKVKAAGPLGTLHQSLEKFARAMDKSQYLAVKGNFMRKDMFSDKYQRVGVAEFVVGKSVEAVMKGTAKGVARGVGSMVESLAGMQYQAKQSREASSQVIAVSGNIRSDSQGKLVEYAKKTGATLLMQDKDNRFRSDMAKIGGSRDRSQDRATAADLWRKTEARQDDDKNKDKSSFAKDRSDAGLEDKERTRRVRELQERDEGRDFERERERERRPRW